MVKTLLTSLLYFVGLAGRTGVQEPGDDRAKLRYAFRVCLAREPSERELVRLASFVARQRADFTGKPGEAKAVSPGAPDRAEWVMVARVLLNLDEFITRE